MFDAFGIDGSVHTSGRLIDKLISILRKCVPRWLLVRVVGDGTLHESNAPVLEIYYDQH